MAESRQLSAMLVQVAERSKEEFVASAAAHSVPVQLARAILHLDKPEPMSELACNLACDRSYVTALADQLEERGLITRVPGDDRRIKLLELTEAGRVLRDALAADVSKRSLVLRQLTDTERAQLGPLLEKLLA